MINTQKNLKLLNLGSSKLDHILSMGQTSKQGLGYTETTNNAATTPKTVFVKAGVTSDVTTTSKIVSATTATRIVNTHFSGNNSTTSPSKGKRRFVPICHFCNRPSHIRPKYFEYQNTFKMGRFEKYNYKSRFKVHKPMNTPKHKIDLKTNHIKKIWVKKIRFKLLCCFYFLKDSFY